MYQREDIKTKIYNQGRDLEVALYNYYFLNDERVNITYALSLYQNEDGGFGHGLEPDNTNPNSTNFQTSYALELLVNSGFNKDNLDEFTNLLVNQAVEYLKKQLKDDLWVATDESNNDFNCAIWWKHNDENLFFENPTVSILGTLLVLLDEKDSFYQTVVKLALKYQAYFMTSEVKEKHLIACYMYLYQGLKHSNLIKDFLMYDKLSNDIKNSIDDKSTWGNGYQTTPFSYPIYNDNYKLSDELINDNLAFLAETYKGNYWDINFTWGNEDDGFDVQSIKWQAVITINYLRLIDKYQN